MADIPETSENIGANPTCTYHEYTIASIGYRNSCLMMIFTFLILILLGLSIIVIKLHLNYLPTGFIPASSVLFFILLGLACYLENLVRKYSDAMGRIKHAERRKQESREFEMEDVSQNSSRRSRESSRRKSHRSENRHITLSRSEQRPVTPNVNEAVDSAPPRRGSRRNTPPVNYFEQAPPRRGQQRITPPASELGRTETPRSESRRFAQSASGSQHTAPRRSNSRNATPPENDEQRFVVSGPCTIVISPA